MGAPRTTGVARQLEIQRRYLDVKQSPERLITVSVDKFKFGDNDTLAALESLQAHGLIPSCSPERIRALEARFGQDPREPS